MYAVYIAFHACLSSLSLSLSLSLPLFYSQLAVKVVLTVLVVVVRSCPRQFSPPLLKDCPWTTMSIKRSQRVSHMTRPQSHHRERLSVIHPLTLKHYVRLLLITNSLSLLLCMSSFINYQFNEVISPTLSSFFSHVESFHET